LNRWKENIGIKALTKFLRIGLIVLGIIVTLILFVETAGRLFNHNFAGYEEILIIVVFWLYMFGCAHASFENSHIKADILDLMIKKDSIRDFVHLIKWTLTLVLGIVLCYWAAQLVIWSVTQGNETTVYRIPLAIGQAAIVFGLAVSTLFNALYLYEEIKGLKAKYLNKGNKEVMP
jgi:TRAP-type C4-dicarboxylate transport system permease small subunit